MNVPKNGIMDSDSMDRMNVQTVGSSRLYAKDVDAGEKVAAIVHMAADSMAKVPEKINLYDAEQVRAVTLEYLRSCERTGALPSKIGVARAMGITRQTIDAFLKSHPDQPSAQFLELLFDACAEALTNAALAGGVREITAIFISKAQFGWRDTITLETPQPQPLGELVNEDELRRRIAENVVIDDFSLDDVPAD